MNKIDIVLSKSEIILTEDGDSAILTRVVTTGGIYYMHECTILPEDENKTIEELYIVTSRDSKINTLLDE